MRTFTLKRTDDKNINRLEARYIKMLIGKQFHDKYWTTKKIAVSDANSLIYLIAIIIADIRNVNVFFSTNYL